MVVPNQLPGFIAVFTYEHVQSNRFGYRGSFIVQPLLLFLFLTPLLFQFRNYRSRICKRFLQPSLFLLSLPLPI
jgi:hypothetical protein